MSNKEENHELLIPFESFSNRGIHKEKPESFQKSFFKDVYFQATEAIVIIDEANKKKRRDFINNDNFEQKLYDVQNVIAFTGRRGTGKTSAMLTFTDCLTSRTNIDFFKDSLKNMKFYSIPYIDASMLEENEDIFEIVLSKMLIELRNRSNQSCYHDLSQRDAHFNDTREKIVSVYNQYVSLKKAPEFDSASSCSLMEKLAEKHDIRSSIVELIQKYIRCMTMCDSSQYVSENVNGYLVICIDDVDMSQKNHMDVMQAIYQYLMLPGIIVMITSNFSMLSASIEQKFHSKVYVSSEQADKALNLCKEQTYDFLRKIIPFDMRIVMPSWRKQDYRSFTSIKVNLGNNENMRKLRTVFNRLESSSLFKDFGGERKISPKELIMTMIAHRTKVFLDVAGEKLHFMEPDSLRNLNDLFYLLYNMNNVDLYGSNDTEVYFRELEANRKVLLNYLYFKMIPECNLSPDEEQVIKEFSRDKLHRKGRRIWDYYYKLFTRAKEKEKIERLYGSDFYSNEIRRNRVENYSFGEFFRVLYFGSRLGLMSKEFIQIILASLSFVMPQFIEIEKKNDPSTDELSYNWDKYNYKPIRDVFRYTLLGTWCEDLFDGRTVDIVVKKNGLNKGNCKNFLSLLMLTPMSTGEIIPVNDNGNEIRISAKLDPTAWFMNLIRIKRINNLQIKKNDSSEILLREWLSEIATSEVIKELYGEAGTENHLQEKLLEGLDEKKILDLSWYLLKNIDITYNVIKRVMIYLIYLSDNNLRDKKTAKPTPVEAIRAFYDKFNKKLNEEFEVYNENKSERWNFNDTFNKIPVVNLFLEKSGLISVEQPLRIEWTDMPTHSDKALLIYDMSINDVLDFCSTNCVEIVSTLKRIYSPFLEQKISKQSAIKITSLILDKQVGEAIIEISNILNNKGE